MSSPDRPNTDEETGTLPSPAAERRATLARLIPECSSSRGDRSVHINAEHLDPPPEVREMCAKSWETEIAKKLSDPEQVAGFAAAIRNLSDPQSLKLVIRTLLALGYCPPSEVDHRVERGNGYSANRLGFRSLIALAKEVRSHLVTAESIKADELGFHFIAGPGSGRNVQVMNALETSVENRILTLGLGHTLPHSPESTVVQQLDFSALPENDPERVRIVQAVYTLVRILFHRLKPQARENLETSLQGLPGLLRGLATLPSHGMYVDSDKYPMDQVRVLHEDVKKEIDFIERNGIDEYLRIHFGEDFETREMLPSVHPDQIIFAEFNDLENNNELLEMLRKYGDTITDVRASSFLDDEGLKRYLRATMSRAAVMATEGIEESYTGVLRLDTALELQEEFGDSVTIYAVVKRQAIDIDALLSDDEPVGDPEREQPEEDSVAKKEYRDRVVALVSQNHGRIKESMQNALQSLLSKGCRLVPLTEVRKSADITQQLKENELRRALRDITPAEQHESVFRTLAVTHSGQKIWHDVLTRLPDTSPEVLARIIPVRLQSLLSSSLNHEDHMLSIAYDSIAYKPPTT